MLLATIMLVQLGIIVIGALMCTYFAWVKGQFGTCEEIRGEWSEAIQQSISTVMAYAAGRLSDKRDDK